MQLKNLFLSAFTMAAVVRGEMGGMSSELGTLMGLSDKRSSSSSSSSSSVKVHAVKVGWNSTLTFSPDELQVNPGELVQFQFYPKNHSVVQSTFSDPCTPMSESTGTAGIKSGFMPVAADATEVPVFTMQVNDTKPIWIYCGQTAHCQKGMVMAINVASGSNKTLSAYKALASEQPISGSSSSSSSSSTDSTGSSGSSDSSTSSSTSSSSSGTTTTASSSSAVAAAAAASSSAAVTTSNAASMSAFNSAGLLGLFIAVFAMIQL